MTVSKGCPILIHHPGCGPTGCKLRTFGYWRDRKHASQIREMNSFLAWLGRAIETFAAPLPDPQDFVEPAWSAEERDKVRIYLRAGRVMERYMGYSHCRFDCGVNDADMGDADLTDGLYVWPEGFVHYVEAHGVKPPAEFIAHVLRAWEEVDRP